MHVEGTYTLAAPPGAVWEALLDPAVLTRCIPGCRELEPTGEHQYRATLQIGVAGIKGTYSGTVALDDIQPPSHYRLNVEGKGGPGAVKASGTLDLEGAPEGTLIRYAGDAELSGTIAVVGQRLVGPAARMLINQFFQSLASVLAERQGSAGGAGAGGG